MYLLIHLNRMIHLSYIRVLLQTPLHLEEQMVQRTLYPPRQAMYHNCVSLVVDISCSLCM
ncbi:hypothetical protein HanIR_Chr11g0559961 [Helianthus annuus]|nr:hypothetical protein HanIR_Chr11g0559961 [Helianthus annuus]